MAALREKLLHLWYRPQCSAWLWGLMPFEWLYRFCLMRRRQAFVSGRRTVYRAQKPVIVVGNISLGGTGKTPLVLWLVEHFQAKGLRVGVVSRGYGAKPPSWPWFVTAGQSARCCGDEPLLLAERTAVPVVIDPIRSRAVKALLARQVVDIILSDDGLQHYALARDVELVLVDAQRGLGNGHCLPVGPLREPIARLTEVDAVLWNGQSDSPQGFGMALKPVALVSLATGKSGPLSQLPSGQRVHALAGIGHPERFFQTLEQLNWKPIPHSFADHAQYCAEQLRFDPALPVVMTEKDAVKCRLWAKENWYYVKVQAQPSAAFIAWLDQRLASL